jgi:GNAT superfamily N-acetyltransferase
VTDTAPGQPAPGRPGRVVCAGPGDIDTLSQVIAEAFLALPPSRWLIEDPPRRREIFPAYFRLHVEHALTTGIVHTTADRTAAALWLPTGPAPPGPPPGYDERLAAVTGRWHPRFTAFDAELERHHPAGTAHHHLALLAVYPRCQGQGTGSMPLAAHHATLDHHGTAAYLEAATVRTRRLYARHGYRLHPAAPIRLPGGGPAMWPMWRPPHPPGCP